MDAPLLIWLAVVAAVAILFMVNTIRRLSENSHHNARRAAIVRTRHGRHHIIEVGDEWEEFFLPGDNMSSTQNDKYISGE